MFVVGQEVFLIIYKDEPVGVRFVSPEFLIKWKNNKGREKDLKDVVLIKKYLAKSS